MLLKLWIEESIRRINRFMQLVGWGVTLGVIGGITIYALQERAIEHVFANEIEVVQVEPVEPEPEPEPRTVLIKVVTNWTPERIAQEIDEAFPDAPIMHKVMKCESGGNIEAYNPTNGSHDNGLFQISAKYHGSRMRALGLDVGDPADNIAYARILYDESGLQPWSASKHCWNK